MRMSRVLLAGAAVAAAGIATSAFTASNTVPDSVAGYGQGDVTGATATAINYIANEDDGTILDAVVFTLTTDVTNATSTMTLKTGASADQPDGTALAPVYDCSVSDAWDNTDMQITCATAGGGLPTRNFQDFNAVGLTVVS